MIRTLLRTKRLYWDGGMGSLLQEKGLCPGELPETWNLSHPDIITGIAREYLAAGSNLINTNTFGANRLKYPADLKEIIFSDSILCRIPEGREVHSPILYRCFLKGTERCCLIAAVVIFFDSVRSEFSRTARNSHRDKLGR